jgi:MFS transporter, OCT family, solute carrier family 22 (organic cation transporter), member 4/5
MSTTEPLLSAGSNDGEAWKKQKQKSSGEGRRRVSIDEALSAHAGEFGRWQLRHFVLVSAAWALEALHTMVIIFADREPATSCAAPCGDPCAGAAGWEWAGGAAASTVAEWGLVCGERYKVGLAQAVFFAGCMIGQCAYLNSFRTACSSFGKEMVFFRLGV